jgi:hypothetical protein
MSKPEVSIEDWYILGKILYGKAQNHPRFAKGTEVRTSTIVDMPRSPKQGDKVETMNTVYILGRSVTANLPATPPADEALIEKLAAIEHERWADWQKWCHKILRDNLNLHKTNMELERVLERWDRQIATPYAKLNKQEKQSDRDQVMRYWPLIKSHAAQEKAAAVLEAQKKLLNIGTGNAEGLASVNTGEISDGYHTLLAELRDGGGK